MRPAPRPVPPIAAPAALRDEYTTTGMVRQAVPLADPSVLPVLRKDADRFREAVLAFRAEGLHRVPYARTPAIDAVAHDPHLTSIIAGVLGEGEPWVMWGSNIQRGTPNAAHTWHVDVESWHWPSVTVVVGLDGCSDANATRCIPCSHTLQVQPAATSDDETVLQAAGAQDSRCTHIATFDDFEAGHFYVFNARCWHRGNPSPSHGRTALFLHYQRACDPRIPAMKDHRAGTWFAEPAAFLAGPGATPTTRTYALPRPYGLLGWLRQPWRRG